MNIVDLLKDTLGAMTSGPKKFGLTLDFISEGVPGLENALTSHIAEALPSDEIINVLSRKLSAWDYEEAPTWGNGTQKNTIERRAEILGRLSLSPALQAIVEDRFPPNIHYDAPIVISRKHDRWYDQARQDRQSFYKDAYSDYLRKNKKWSEQQINDLEESTRLVAERLSDPEKKDIYPVRGLVVGYVQSGKTANFTGVVARAADAGYRLIIVLAGTLNILRSQTQRRFDRELIGRPFINEENEPSYISDLSEFIDHGELPSERGIFDWHRLTNSKGDYRRLQQGIQSLEFRKRDKAKSFNDPANLNFESARLLIVKKVPDVLKKFAADLNEIKALSRLADIPTLVIDDESDQASVNTKKPTKKEIEERTATNSAIVSLLKQLPRAQYVGYTATPFANVFIDPNIAENLFPRDFIITLPRPTGYMGVADFHDLDRPDKSIPGKNESAFVRNVIGGDDSPENLEKAIDSFILAGAIKLYRLKLDPDLKRNYRHHTMLVHSSSLKADHTVMAQQVNNILQLGGYLSGKAWDRMKLLWKDDFEKVCNEISDGFPVPNTFAVLKPFLGECWKRLSNGPKKVLIVNGDTDDNPDFEGDSVWKIIVGGAKLSRGYTIEGLTVSYYRRRTGAADALMQMGRWFGFRGGYRDLVRLFIGRQETSGKNRTVDLYAAFEGVCRDEIDFRAELKRYANPETGDPILPIQIPPLVPSHFLQPTAKNKMYNTFIEFKNFSEEWKEPTRAPFEESDIKKNQLLMKSMFGTKLRRGALSIHEKASGTKLVLPTAFSVITTETMVSFLKNYIWIDEDRTVLNREIDFLLSGQDTCVDQWLFVCFDGPIKSAEVDISGEKFKPFNRSRVGTAGRFGVYSESDHRTMARYLAGLDSYISDNQATHDLRSTRQGVFVFYPTRDRHDITAPITPGFALQFPSNQIVTPIRFGVRVQEKADDVVV